MSVTTFCQGQVRGGTRRWGSEAFSGNAGPEPARGRGNRAGARRIDAGAAGRAGAGLGRTFPGGRRGRCDQLPCLHTERNFLGRRSGRRACSGGRAQGLPRIRCTTGVGNGGFGVALKDGSTGPAGRSPGGLTMSTESDAFSLLQSRMPTRAFGARIRTLEKSRRLRRPRS